MRQPEFTRIVATEPAWEKLRASINTAPACASAVRPIEFCGVPIEICTDAEIVGRTTQVAKSTGEKVLSIRIADGALKAVVIDGAMIVQMLTRHLR